MKSIFSLLLGMCVLSLSVSATISPPTPPDPVPDHYLVLEIGTDMAVEFSITESITFTATDEASVEGSTHGLTTSPVVPCVSIGTTQGSLLHYWHDSLATHQVCDATLIHRYLPNPVRIRMNPPVPPRIFGQSTYLRTIKLKRHVRSV